MSPLNHHRPPSSSWMAALGEHDAPGLFETPAPPPPPAALQARAASKPRRPAADLPRIEHHVCALDSPCL